jgi:integrase
MKMDGEAWLANERRLIEQETWTPPAERSVQTKSITLVAYGKSWIASRNLKERTRSHYSDLLTKHLASLDQPLKALTPEKVRAWHSTTLVDKPTMRSHSYGLLHAILATACTDGEISSNPATIPRAMKANRRRQPVLLSRPEVAKLAQAIKPERSKALILIAAWAGLRWGEVTELRRKDIGPGAETITVSRGVTHRQGCTISSPKSGRGRVVVVPPHIRADLKHHLDSYVGKAPDAQLFPPARGGCHLIDKVFREHFLQALKSIGREGVRVHDLRHFAGTQTASVASLTETMGRLGHSTPGASLVYQSVATGRDAEVAEALSRLALADEADEA